MTRAELETIAATIESVFPAEAASLRRAEAVPASPLQKKAAAIQAYKYLRERSITSADERLNMIAERLPGIGVEQLRTAIEGRDSSAKKLADDPEFDWKKYLRFTDTLSGVL